MNTRSPVSKKMCHSKESRSHSPGFGIFYDKPFGFEDMKLSVQMTSPASVGLLIFTEMRIRAPDSGIFGAERIKYKMMNQERFGCSKQPLQI